MINFWGVLLAYLLGSIPTGFLLVKWRRGVDPRERGSGDIGAANVAQVAGRNAGLAVLAVEAAKGYAAVWLAGVIAGGAVEWMAGAAVAVCLGNAYPLFLDFHGGSATPSLFGAFFRLAPGAAAALVPVLLVTVALTRQIAAASIVAAAAFPLAVWLIGRPPGAVMAASVVGAALVLWRHRASVERLRAGTEPRV